MNKQNVNKFIVQTMERSK